MVKSETAKALTTTSTTQDSEINQIIFDTQQWLASEYDWPFLQARWDIALPPSSRYIAFPTVDDVNLATAINFERAGCLKMFIKWNNIWQTVDYGIREIEEFNYIDSDRGQVLDPVQRWMFDDENKFEIWPMNASSQTLRFIGQRVLTELRNIITPLPVTWNDTATLDLDDVMVAYMAAAEYMLRSESNVNIAKLLLQKGNTRMTQIRATYPTIEHPATIVGGSTIFDRRAMRIVPLVVVGGR